jgi:hypothetical protein
VMLHYQRIRSYADSFYYRNLRTVCINRERITLR